MTASQSSRRGTAERESTWRCSSELRRNTAEDNTDQRETERDREKVLCRDCGSNGLTWFPDRVATSTSTSTVLSLSSFPITVHSSRLLAHPLLLGLDSFFLPCQYPPLVSLAPPAVNKNNLPTLLAVQNHCLLFRTYWRQH